MQVLVDVQTIVVQLNNGLVTTPAEIELEAGCITMGVYVPGEGDIMAMHQFSIEMVGSEVRFVERSPLGSKPNVRILHDFAKDASG